jgi:hypothetical protein
MCKIHDKQEVFKNQKKKFVPLKPSNLAWIEEHILDTYAGKQLF